MIKPFRVIASQNITTSGTSQQSAAAPANARACRVALNGGAAYIAIGPSPVANATTGILVHGNDTAIFSITAGEKVAVLQITSPTTASIAFLT